MTTKLLYAAETWEHAYAAFENINFTAYDFDSVKQSLLDYLKLKYPENFNDYIESSQLIAIVELFAYIAEQHAYRVDMATHENLLSTAARKQSILRLARLVSYTAARNMPLRGLVKIDSVTISENLTDSQGNNLANKPIKWADSSNLLWREQFNLALNRLFIKPIGNPSKSFQSAATLLQTYEVANLTEADTTSTSFSNGTLKLQINLNGKALPFELVPADIDEGGVFERTPDPFLPFTIVLTNDGYGDDSPMTGYQMYMKQGTLSKLNYTFDVAIPNQVLELNVPGVNDTDVWLQQVDAANMVTAEWTEVKNVNGDNLAFNTLSGYQKYEVETLEDDKVKIVFGAGDFSDIPVGTFRIWVRASASGNLTLPAAKLQKASVTFAYMSKQGQHESCTLEYSLGTSIQNASEAETIEHIRSVAPGVYQAQNRMVNGEDYNSFPLQDPSIIHLKAVNRTFAGQPKYIEWNDASGAYQNVKVFGDDARMYYNISSNTISSKLSSRSLIDEVIEPLLSSPGVYNLINYSYFSSPTPLSQVAVRPRTRFIEDASILINNEPLQEKTLIQGALDRHWYGEPITRVSLGPDLTPNTSPKSYYGVVNNDVDQRVYDANLKLVVANSTGYTAVPTPGGVSGIQDAVSRQRRFGIRFNPERAFTSNVVLNSATVSVVGNTSVLLASDIQATTEEVFTIELVGTQGEFTVFGSQSGILPGGTVGELYDNGLLSFIINKPGATPTTPFVVTPGLITPGDSFVIIPTRIDNILVPSVYERNLMGIFELVDESQLDADAETQAYDIADIGRNWVLIIERVDDVDGKLLYWKVTNRSFDLTVESATTKFWYDAAGYLVDPETKTRVRDQIKILKSNLTLDKTKVLGTDQRYYVVNRILNANGEVNFNALLVSPDSLLANEIASSTGDVSAPFQFLQFIGNNEYVYFLKSNTGTLTPVDTTVYIESLDYVNNEAGNYVRKLGRGGLDFSWVHYVDNENVVDPSPSNIIDMYVLTKGYWAAINSWLNGEVDEMPIEPSPYELRSTYRTILASKMISDTVIMHSAKLKLLFGQRAAPELRAKLKLVKTSSSRLTDDQLKIKALALIQAYFAIEDWPLGKEFYATELCSVLHAKLPIDVQSAVLVPEFPLNTFGDLFYVRAAADEMLVNAMQLDDILIVTGLDKTILKQSF